MGTTKLKFETADASWKVSTKTFGYVNPEASDYTLKSLVHGAYALSNNTVRNIYRINTRDITNATEEVTPTTPVGKTAISISSTSDFFSTNATSFHNFVQAALAADAENGNADDTAALSFIAMTDFPIMFDFTYGDLTTLQSNANATIQDVVTLLNSKLQEAAELEELEDFDVTASFSGTALTFSTNEDTLSWNITTGMGETGKYIMKSIYDNAADTSGFTDDGGGDYTFNKKIE